MRIAPSMRSPWRALLGLTVVAAALTAWTVPARAEGEVVTIAPLEGEPVQVSLDDPELPRDIDGAVYELRFSDGGAAMKERVTDGVTLLNLLKAAGLHEADFAYVEIPRPPGDTSLGRGPITIPATDLDGGKPPAVYVDGEGALRFIRASAGPKDHNGDDWVQFPDGAMSMNQLESDGIEVTVEAPARVRAGVPFQVEARVTGGALGARYTYEWVFEDDRRRRGRVAEHPGIELPEDVLAVSLTVRDQDGVRHQAPLTTIRVGQALPPRRPGSPDGDSGSTPATPAPTGDSAPPPAPDYDYDGNYDYSYDSAADNAPPATAGSTSDPFESTGGSGLKLDDGTVEGYLLADASTSPSSATADAVQAAREGFVEDEPDDGAIPTAVWALLGTLALVTAGAGLETGPSGPRAALARVPRMRGGRLSRLLRRRRT